MSSCPKSVVGRVFVGRADWDFFSCPQFMSRSVKGTKDAKTLSTGGKRYNGMIQMHSPVLNRRALKAEWTNNSKYDHELLYNTQRVLKAENP